MENIDAFETKEIEIDWNGKKEIVTIRELSFGEQTALQEKYVTTALKGNTLDASVNLFGLKQEALKLSIVKAPFSDVTKIPNSLAKILLAEVESFVDIDTAKKESGVEQQEEAESEQEPSD